MDSNAHVALIAGGFALVGVLGGASMTAWFGIVADRRRTRVEDERRWLLARREHYAGFLGLATSMLREIDGVAIFLSHSSDSPVTKEDEEYIREGLLEYQIKWNEVLQPALGEVQLLGSPRVAELADRVSGALLEVTTVVETRGAFTEYYPSWFQTGDLIQVLRDAMRQELGLESMPPQSWDSRRSDDWPWLPDRPSRDSYRQETSDN